MTVKLKTMTVKLKTMTVKLKTIEMYEAEKAEGI